MQSKETCLHEVPNSKLHSFANQTITDYFLCAIYIHPPLICLNVLLLPIFNDNYITEFE